jgi:hypothetical protein
MLFINIRLINQIKLGLEISNSNKKNGTQGGGGGNVQTSITYYLNGAKELASMIILGQI